MREGIVLLPFDGEQSTITLILHEMKSSDDSSEELDPTLD